MPWPPKVCPHSLDVPPEVEADRAWEREAARREAETEDEVADLRAENERLGRLLEELRHLKLDNLNRDGKTILDLMNVWLDRERDANLKLRHDAAELRGEVSALRERAEENTSLRKRLAACRQRETEGEVD